MNSQGAFVVYALFGMLTFGYVTVVAACMTLIPLRFVLRPLQQPHEWRTATAGKRLRIMWGCLAMLLPVMFVGFAGVIAWHATEHNLIRGAVVLLAGVLVAGWATVDFFAIRRLLQHWSTHPALGRVTAARRYELARRRSSDTQRMLLGLLVVAAGWGSALAYWVHEEDGQIEMTALVTLLLMVAAWASVVWFFDRARPLDSVVRIYDFHMRTLLAQCNSDGRRGRRVWWNAAPCTGLDPAVQFRLQSLVGFIDLELFRQAGREPNRFRPSVEDAVEQMVADLAARVRDRRDCLEELHTAVETCVTGALPHTTAAGTKSRSLGAVMVAREIRWEWVFRTLLAATVGIIGKALAVI